jgi:hypothetical protein
MTVIAIWLKPHWHRYNPWRDDLVYIPVERLAECVVGGTINGKTPEDLVKRWHQNGRDKLDAYILPQPSGEHDLGVRYGKEPEEYYSPPNHNIERTEYLLALYRKIK